MNRRAALPPNVLRAISLGQGVPRESVRVRGPATAAEWLARGVAAQSAVAGILNPGVRPRGRSRLQAAWLEECELRRRAGIYTLVLEEAISLRLAERTWYRPDGLVVDARGRVHVHEVKGHVEDDARVKFKVAAEMHRWATFWWITREGKGRERRWVQTPLVVKT